MTQIYKDKKTEEIIKRMMAEIFLQRIKIDRDRAIKEKYN